MTEVEHKVVGAEEVFDLESSFDLGYFCMKRETLKMLTTGLKLPKGFLATVSSLRDESVFSCAGKWQDNHSEKWMSKPRLVYLLLMSAIS